MTSPRVAVITIFYNAEKYLTEAIESVFSQTFNDWQLILVDDGSQDGSTEIAKRVAQDFPAKVIYCEHNGHANRGMSASRNVGIKNSTGEFVAFIDADDVWLPEKLADQVAILDRAPDAAMVYGKAKAWYQWNRKDERTDHYWDLGVTPNQLIYPPTLFALLMENQAQSPMTSNCMVRRDVIELLDGFEEQFRGMYEDCVFFSKVHLAYPTYVSNKCWVLYRQHADSCTSHQLRKEYATHRLPFLEWLGVYIDSVSQPIPEIAQRAFDRELWRCKYPKLNYWINYAPKRIAALAGLKRA